MMQTWFEIIIITVITRVVVALLAGWNETFTKRCQIAIHPTPESVQITHEKWIYLNSSGVKYGDRATSS